MRYIDVNGGRPKQTGLKGSSGKTYGTPALFSQVELDEMLADGIAVYNPPPVPPKVQSIERIKDRRKHYLADAYGYVISQPISVSIQGQDKTFPMTAQDREWVSGMNSALGAGWTPGAGFYRKDKDGVRVTLNMAAIKQIGKAQMERTEAETEIFDDLLDAVDAAVDSDAVNAIVWPWVDGVDPRVAL